MQTTCPDHDQLVALLDSSVRDEDSAAIEQHVVDCKACEQRLASIVSGDGNDGALGDWDAYRQMLDTKAGNQSDTFPKFEIQAEVLINGLENKGFSDLTELGRGGMGIVFAANQPAMQRTVAIKLLQWGALAGPQRTARLLAEARAIGQLNHENVLKIFDTIDSDGTPGLVLEYADAGSLHAQLEDGPLPTDEAVRIATAVAAGLAHAHENNILHRDIKPANVLLSGDGTKPTVKVADFGLAKDIDQSTELTGSLILGTPTYMSPEQISGDHSAVSTTSDVYSLGVVLYEMLVGAPPFRGPSPAAVHHLITTQPPVPPKQIQPSISRDLETICLKCLEKSPKDRYPSAKELLDDLQRLSDSRPITARRASLAQRSMKWCRRKPAIAALIGTVAVGLLATASVWGVMTSQLTQVNGELEERNNALGARNNELDAANAKLNETIENLRLQQLATSRQLSATNALRNFLVKDLLANASAHQRMNAAAESQEGTDDVAELTARQLVLRAIAKLEGDGLEDKFPKQPNVQAEVLTALSVICREMGEYDMAVELGERAIEVHPASMAEFDKDHFENLQSYAVQLVAQGDFERVIEISELIVQQAAKHGEKRMQFGSMHNMAGAYMMLDQPELGVEYSEAALSGFNELLGPNDPLTLQVSATHGQILQDLGRYDDAALVLASSVAGFTELVTEKHPRTISAIGKLASVLTSAKEYERAIEYYHKQISLSNEVLGADHPKTMMAEANLGSCLYKSGAVAEGIAAMELARDRLYGKLGQDHYFPKAIDKEIQKAEKLLD
ncbi:MAG: hypothetical protein Aurels2KO_49180 [Aureliella sp.]